MDNRSALGWPVRCDLAVKYQQSVLGYPWSLIEPLAMAAIYHFIFGVLYGSRRNGTGFGRLPYTLFLTGIFA